MEVPEESPPGTVQSEINWSELAYSLGLQGLAQEIAVNSALDTFDADKIRLIISPELKDIASASILLEIQQAITSKLNVSCKLDLIGQPNVGLETPFEARKGQQEADRQIAINVIRGSEIVSKFNRAFGAELIESSVAKHDE